MSTSTSKFRRICYLETNKISLVGFSDGHVFKKGVYFMLSNIKIVHLKKYFLIDKNTMG